MMSQGDTTKDQSIAGLAVGTDKYKAGLQLITTCLSVALL